MADQFMREGEDVDDRPGAATAVLPRQSPGFDEPEPQAETKKAIAIEGTALFEHSPQIDQIFGALAEAQGKIVQPIKQKQAKVKGNKNGRDYEYNYWYCDISDVLNACLVPFSQSGIAQMQFPTIEEFKIQIGDGPKTRPGAMVHVRTVLGHKSGQWISCTLRALADSFDPQDLGAVITYLRRYGLQLIGGIAADEDEDGVQGGQANGSGAPSKPADPQRSGEGKSAWETVTLVLDYKTAPAQGGKVKHNIKLQGIGKDGADAWASTLDKQLGEKIGREMGTNVSVKIQLKRAGQYIELIGGSTVPPDGQ